MFYGSKLPAAAVGEKPAQAEGLCHIAAHVAQAFSLC
jgi:hypothetical protein